MVNGVNDRSNRQLSTENTADLLIGVGACCGGGVVRAVGNGSALCRPIDVMYAGTLPRLYYPSSGITEVRYCVLLLLL